MKPALPAPRSRPAAAPAALFLLSPPPPAKSANHTIVLRMHARMHASAHMRTHASMTTSAAHQAGRMQSSRLGAQTCASRAPRAWVVGCFGCTARVVEMLQLPLTHRPTARARGAPCSSSRTTRLRVRAACPRCSRAVPPPPTSPTPTPHWENGGLPRSCMWSRHGASLRLEWPCSSRRGNRGIRPAPTSRPPLRVHGRSMTVPLEARRRHMPTAHCLLCPACLPSRSVPLILVIPPMPCVSLAAGEFYNVLLAHYTVWRAGQELPRASADGA